LKNKYSESHDLINNKEEERQMTAKMLMEDQKHCEITYRGDIENEAVLLGQNIGLILDLIREVNNRKDHSKGRESIKEYRFM